MILLALRFVSADSQAIRSPDKGTGSGQTSLSTAVGHCQGGRSLPTPGEGFKAEVQAAPFKHIPCTCTSLVQDTARGFFKAGFESPALNHQSHQQSSPRGTGEPQGSTGSRVCKQCSTAGTRLLQAPPLSLPAELYLIEEKKWRRGTSKHQTYRSCK